MRHRHPRPTRCLLAPSLVLLTALGVGAAGAAETVTVELVGGDKVTGELVSRDDRETVIQHAVFGRLVIPSEKLAHEDGPTPGLFGTSFLKGWHKEVGFGLTGSEGNSEELSGRLNLALVFEDELRRWDVEGAYKLAREDGDRTDHFGNLEGRRDWLFPGSRWFAFLGSRYQYDEFEPWEHRIQTYAGPGYHVLKGDPYRLDVFVGVSSTYEFGSVTTLRPEGLLGIDFRWKPRDGVELRLKNRLFPQLNEPEYRNLTSSSLKMKIANLEHLSFVLGFDNEYDSAAQDERNNLKYWSSIAYDF